VWVGEEEGARDYEYMYISVSWLGGCPNRTSTERHTHTQNVPDSTGKGGLDGSWRSSWSGDWLRVGGG